MKSQKKTRLELRISDIPEDIYKRIKQDARNNVRTMSKEVIYKLKTLYKL
jgi:hypothetical protein